MILWIRWGDSYGHHLWERFFPAGHLSNSEVTIYGMFKPPMTLDAMVPGRFPTFRLLWATFMGLKSASQTLVWVSLGARLP